MLLGLTHFTVVWYLPVSSKVGAAIFTGGSSTSVMLMVTTMLSVLSGASCLSLAVTVTS